MTKNKIDDGGPAFPEPVAIGPSGDAYPAFSGMTLRDYFPAKIASGMAAFSGTAGVSYGPGDIAGRSYEIADEMLKAREVKNV